MMTPKYSRSYINKVGEILAGGNHAPEEVESALITLNDWRALHLIPLNTLRKTLRNYVKTTDTNGIVVQRLKRAPTIIDKLKRYPTMELKGMQDVGGLRTIVKSVPNVREIEKKLCFSRARHVLKRKYDYIAEPKESGYRGIHFVFEYQNPNNLDCDGLHVEIQLRTRLQHLWATAVETAGFVFRESLKSSQGEGQHLEFFQLVSALFAHEEKQPVAEPLRQAPRETLIVQLKQTAEKSGILQMLDAVQTVHAIDVPKLKNTAYWIIKTTREPLETILYPYTESQRNMANVMYHLMEGSPECLLGNTQVVLVSADSLTMLAKAYPNLFLEARDFVSIVVPLLTS